MNETIFTAIVSLISAFIGAVIGSMLTGGFTYWQSRELAKHNLRSVVARLGMHAKQSRGGCERRTDPMSTALLDEAIASYHRYRALLISACRKRSLDVAWTRFQGNSPGGNDPLSHVQLLGEDGARRAVEMLRFLGAPTFSGV